MKTQLTKRMEKALIIDALGKSKHPALEVEYWHTESIGAGIYRPIGQAEYIDAVIEKELKIIEAANYLARKNVEKRISNGRR